MLFLIRFCDDFRKILRQEFLNKETKLFQKRRARASVAPSRFRSCSFQIFRPFQLICSFSVRVFAQNRAFSLRILCDFAKFCEKNVFFAIFKSGMRIFLMNPFHWITKKLFSLKVQRKNTRCSKSMRRGLVKICILVSQVGAFGAKMFCKFWFFSTKMDWILSFLMENDSISVREWSIVIRRKLPGGFYALSYCRSSGIFGYFNQ